jgi:hypothetical protein
MFQNSSGNSPGSEMIEDYQMIILRLLVADMKNDAQKSKQKNREGRKGIGNAVLRLKALRR